MNNGVYNGIIENISLDMNYHYNCVFLNLLIRCNGFSCGFMGDIVLANIPDKMEQGIPTKAIYLLSELCKLKEPNNNEIVSLNDLKGVPIRVFVEDFHCVGVGHFMKDDIVIMKKDVIEKLKDAKQ